MRNMTEQMVFAILIIACGIVGLTAVVLNSDYFKVQDGMSQEIVERIHLKTQKKYTDVIWVRK